MTVIHRVTAIYRAVIYRFDCICISVAQASRSRTRHTAKVKDSGLYVSEHVQSNGGRDFTIYGGLYQGRKS